MQNTADHTGLAAGARAEAFADDRVFNQTVAQAADEMDTTGPTAGAHTGPEGGNDVTMVEPRWHSIHDDPWDVVNPADIQVPADVQDIPPTAVEGTQSPPQVPRPSVSPTRFPQVQGGSTNTVADTLPPRPKLQVTVSEAKSSGRPRSVTPTPSQCPAALPTATPQVSANPIAGAVGVGLAKAFVFGGAQVPVASTQVPFGGATSIQSPFGGAAAPAASAQVPFGGAAAPVANTGPSYE